MHKSSILITTLWVVAFAAAIGPATASAEVERVTVMGNGGYFPVAIRLAGGEILAVMRAGAPHIGKQGRLVLSISEDAGRTWSKPWTAVDGPEDDRNPALGQLEHDVRVTVVSVRRVVLRIESRPQLPLRKVLEAAHRAHSDRAKQVREPSVTVDDPARAATRRAVEGQDPPRELVVP